MATYLIKATLTMIAIAIGAATYASGNGQGDDLSKFQALKDPRISTMKNQKMLVVEAKGDPNVVGAKAIGLLFQLYYSIKETPKGPVQPAMKARWPSSIDTPKSEWLGLYGLAVPESVNELPPHQVPDGLKVTLTTWEYGEVGEILHVGPYDKEEPSFHRLKEFLARGGYVTVGGHEEEYIKGPTMSGKGDPEKYLTIIRYRVQKSPKNQ